MIYKKKPKIFLPTFQVVSCFCENQGRILLLRRNKEKPQSNTWGVPAGKLSEFEKPEKGMVRELREETGIEISSDRLVFLQRIFVVNSSYSFEYYIYKSKIKKCKIRLNKSEHSNYKWVMPIEALSMNLIEDLNSCIELYYRDLPLPYNQAKKISL